MVTQIELAEDRSIIADISTLKTFWGQRNKRMKEWYSILTLIDYLKAKGLESYISNEPQTFYNMSHYLLTKGEISHISPLVSETGLELDRKAKVNRGCKYMWDSIDRNRNSGGEQTFISELGFFLLITGWYSVVLQFDSNTGGLNAQLWNPVDCYPKYLNNSLYSFVHSYKVTEEEAVAKATANVWNYTTSSAGSISSPMTTIDDYFIMRDGILWNKIFIGGKAVSPLEDRPDMKILIAPVGGFPDKGSLTPGQQDWRQRIGRSIFEVNDGVMSSFNKWKTMLSQILRDTAQPVTQEFSATPQATPEQLRERGALFHYSPNDRGLERLAPPSIPIELQGNLFEARRELQKGSFNDAVFGMMEGQQAGYALSLLATSSANQVLYPFMDAKHFVLAESDNFWLSNLKKSNKTFKIKGDFIEEIKPEDIPEDISITVKSTVATPKDWMERGTIAGMVRPDLDTSTILTEVYGLTDVQGIRRRKSVDDMLEHPMSKMIELIAGYTAHADYLENRGDLKQAALFRRAAANVEAQLGAPPPGAAKPNEPQPTNTGVSEKKTRVRPEVMPPEERGFSPQTLRNSIGRGKVRTV